MGIEPTTFCLGSRRSTSELRPRCSAPLRVASSHSGLKASDEIRPVTWARRRARPVQAWRRRCLIAHHGAVSPHDLRPAIDRCRSCAPRRRRRPGARARHHCLAPYHDLLCAFAERAKRRVPSLRGRPDPPGRCRRTRGRRLEPAGRALRPRCEKAADSAHARPGQLRYEARPVRRMGRAVLDRRNPGPRRGDDPLGLRGSGRPSRLRGRRGRCARRRARRVGVPAAGDREPARYLTGFALIPRAFN